jgi:raffinose/stachyose/melibiose transport system permease protein
MKKSDNYCILFVLPSVLLFGFAVLIPFVNGINIAFTDWNGVSQSYNYIGFTNFVRLFMDRAVLGPIRNTLYFALVYTAANNLIALVLAVLLDKWVRGKNVLKTIFFIPMALSAVLAAFVWGFIFKSVFSTFFGINSLLGNPKTVIPGIIVIALWNSVGSNLIIYMAGLSNIPKIYTEASEIDGANFPRQFRHIIIPMLGPSFTICITLTFTSALREFGTVMAATGGGPAGYSETVSIFIYRNLFSFQKAGYGQAASLLFMVLLIIIGGILARFFRNREVES